MENVLGSIDISSKVTKQTLKESDITMQTEKDLGMMKIEPKPWFINSFWTIGWPDPFPDEHSNADKDFLRNKEDLVYQDSRYVKETSPSVIYIPNKVVMIKIMRACIGVTYISELWIR